MPTQRLIRMMIEAQLGQAGAKPKRKPQGKTASAVAYAAKGAVRKTSKASRGHGTIA